MGSQLKTWRIKQAISVVSLFVHQCLLGLEDEALVKLFIYPENWVEPSLRDVKSQLFEKFGASLMKKHLSVETFEQALKTHLHRLNGISSLEVLTFVIYVQDHLRTEMYHFSARTRSAPHSFYYRTLKIARQDTPEGIWRPRTKIEMDVPTVETERQGKRLDMTGTHLISVMIGARLYLFIPHIVAKTSPPGTEKPADYEEETFGDLAKTNSGSTKPQKSWEITMGWTELAHGSWSLKRVATGSVKVVDYLQPLNEMRFKPQSDSDVSSPRAKLLITCWPPPIGRPKKRDLLKIKLGGIQFCEDQMVVLTQAEVFELHTSIEVFQSTFQQLVITDQSAQDVRKAFEDDVDDDIETALGQVVEGRIAKEARRAIKDEIDKNVIEAIKAGGISRPLR
ncbi:hypothetical protein HZ326_31723 [Fusarium oxysporum f. sp. albedinis]|nr:hypothetical protein HZ326_31723 [Fusarium oxysporum f. sp. albedinis]